MAGLFDPTDPTAGGLMNGFASQQGMPGMMGMLANPQTAGLLGMAGGLLSAAGPSRLPVTNGQALGAGFSGMQQGIGNAMQNQRAMLTMQAMQGLLGGNSGTTGPQNSGPSGGPVAPSPAVTGSANTGALSGPMAGLGGFAPQPESAASSAQAEIPSAPTSQGVSIFGRTPQQLWQQGMAMNLAGIPGGADMMKIAVQYDPTLAYAMPTDQMKNVAAATGGPGTPGFTNGMQGILSKDTTVSLRPGAPYMSGGQVYGTPPAAPPGFMNVPDSTAPNGWRVAPVPGGTEAVSGSAAAQAGGKAQYDIQPVWQQDPQTGQYVQVQQTRANVANAANGTPAAADAGRSGVPLPLRNNNPGAVSPGGSVANYPDLQTGLHAMDQNLASYAGQKDTGTLGGVITKWVGSAPNAPAYIKDVTGRLGVGANTPVDLTNPAQRQAIATAIMLHENGPAAVFGGGAAPQAAAPSRGAGGPMLAAPPIGAQTAVENTAKDNAGNYNNLSQFASASPDRVNTLDNMMALAQGTTKFGPGWEGRLDRMAQINSYLPSGMAFGSDNAANAQTFQKYASYLVQQYQRAMGGHQTDAQLNTVIHGTPNPEMLNQTMQEVIPKLKAMELAVQAKATAGDNWMAQHGNNATNYNQFESMWRQNYDPRIYQMQQMDLPARAAFMKSQPDANALRAKVSTALQNGWVQ